MATIHNILETLVKRYNRVLGYNGRYRVVAALDRGPHEPRLLALYKREGTRELNVSSWLRPMELASYISGGIETAEAIQRRAARGEIPTTLRIAAAGLEVGFAGVFANGVFTKETS